MKPVVSPVWPVVFALAVATLFVSTVPTRACLNDRDTLADEARGLPDDVIAAISGRFPRNPPLFYQMRIKREQKQLLKAPRNYDLYDDVAVAFDRISQDDNALRVIEQKRAFLPPFAQAKTNAKTRENWYRYFANSGTFRMHRWLHNGANRAKLGEVKAARDLIRQAVHLKPNAHFGREKYQLKLMGWVLAPPKPSGEVAMPDALNLGPRSNYGYQNDPTSSHLGELGEGNAIRGLSGLVMLGSAWESVDVFHALTQALAAGGKNDIAYLSGKRVQELVRNGKRSLNPNAPTDLQERLQTQEHFLESRADKQRGLDALYPLLRADADNYQALRTSYMMPRLQAGRHPDTDASFWSDWREPPRVSLVPPPDTRPRAWAIVGGALLLSLAALVIAHQRRRQPRRGRARRADA